MPRHYGNSGMRNGRRRSSSSRRVRRGARPRVMPRRMGSGGYHTHASRGGHRRQNGRYVIASGSGKTKTWYSCSTPIITGECRDITEHYNMENYLG
tara:strand:+ start:216 stop:503 length:288 start_codon:yes stop_codon:yes gene_type:complete